MAANIKEEHFKKSTKLYTLFKHCNKRYKNVTLTTYTLSDHLAICCPVCYDNGSISIMIKNGHSRPRRIILSNCEVKFVKIPKYICKHCRDRHQSLDEDYQYSHELQPLFILKGHLFERIVYINLYQRTEERNGDYFFAYVGRVIARLNATYPELQCLTRKQLEETWKNQDYLIIKKQAMDSTLI